VIQRTTRAAALALVASLLASGCGITGFREPSREEVLNRILPASVQIVVEDGEDRRIASGSGVAIASRTTVGGRYCFVLTSGQVLSGAARDDGIGVVFGRHDNKQRKVPATLLAHRQMGTADLALLRTEAGDCAPPAPAPSPVLGQPVWIVAFPWGRHMTLASGVVSQVNSSVGADPEAASRLMVDASVSYGVSGAGVYDGRDGGLVGIVEAHSTARLSPRGSTPAWYIDVPVPGQTVVTPLIDIRRFLKDTGYADLMAPARGRRSLARGSIGPVPRAADER
jgi:hypothetical protein